ncbi:MAG TPA: F0F1 ATP synthase subunit delta [Gemmataceae bacterium]|nr:F0F1 ATP synthase subunit delta [Gemmataceae bacterium]
MRFNLWTFLLEALNFVVLAYVLYRILYRPLRKAIEGRREAAQKAQAEAEKAVQEAAAMKERLRAEEAQIERRREEAIRKAHEQAEAERKRLLAEAEQAAAKQREEARRALERERAEALQALRGEVIGQAVSLARRLLQEAAEADLDRQLALRLAQTLDGLPDAERQRVRADWQPGDGAVLESANGLDGTTVARVGEAVSAVLGRPVTVAVQTRPELIGGARVRLGGHVWDATVAGQLEGTSPTGGEGEQPCPSAPSS